MNQTTEINQSGQENPGRPGLLFREFTSSDPISGLVAERAIERLFLNSGLSRILLVLPPEGDSSMFNYDTGKRGRYWNFPPYGPGVLATLIRDMGLEADILNLNHEVLKACRESDSSESFDFNQVWQSALEKRIRDFKPDFIGLSVMFTQTHKAAVETANHIKTLAPGVPLALGGAHITNCFQCREEMAHILEDYHNVDLFFLYESELTAPKFFKAVLGLEPAQGLAQVCFNFEYERLYFSDKNLPAAADGDVRPAFDLMDVPELSRAGTIGSFFCLKDETPVVATSINNRGCRGRCTYCSVRNFNGANVRHRPVSSVVDELLHLRDEYGVNHIMWLDDDFLYNHKRSLNLFNEMVKRQVGLTWDCTNGVVAASCTDEIIQAAAESGCIGLNVGIESGNPETLAAIRKPSRVHNFLDAAKVFKKHPQINTRGFLMIGFPGETYSRLLDTCRLAVDMDLDWYNITILQPLPNTPIFEEMNKLGQVDEKEAEKIRFNSGPYGKRREKVIKNELKTMAGGLFEGKDLDLIPSRSELDEIWMQMNFHLNFRRLFFVDHPVKLQQHLKYVGFITSKVAPDDPLPMYFYSRLLWASGQKPEPELIQKMKDKLTGSSYWAGVFESFGLNPDDAATGRFPMAGQAS